MRMLQHKGCLHVLLPVILLALGAGSVFAQTEKNFSGEIIQYDIKNFGIDSGDAFLEFKAGQVVDGRTLDLIIFRATAINFLDEEKIYMDPEKLLPVKVERNLNIFGKKENITEYYDSKKGEVRIVKRAGGKETKQIIQKQGALDNIYCFIYRYRRAGVFQLGDTLVINLPTKDVAIKLKKKDMLKIAGEKFDTFFMQSDPRKYKIWFDVSKNKIPLRIDGSVGFGNTYMVMTAYQKQDLEIGK